MSKNIYKLIFAKNEIMTCERIVNEVKFSGEYNYEHDGKGRVIYAYVKAENEDEAINRSSEIIKAATQKVLGNDFIT